MVKKRLMICIVAVGIALACGASALKTKMWGYSALVISAAGGEGILDPTADYGTTVPTVSGTLGPLDLRKYGYSETSANAVEILAFATASDSDAFTVALYGWANGNTGPPEFIASLSFICGTAVKDTGILWAESCSVTDTHITTVKASAPATNDIVKVTFDATGYRYLQAIVHTRDTGTPTIITLILRPIG